MGLCFGHIDRDGLIHCGAAGRACHAACRPLQDRLCELPWVRQGGALFSQQTQHFLGVGTGLLGGHQATLAEHPDGHHEANWLNMAEPLCVRIEAHKDQFVSGQR